MKQLATIALFALLAIGVYAGVRGGDPAPICLPDVGCVPPV